MPCCVGLITIGIMPPRKGQMVTLATHQDSQDLTSTKSRNAPDDATNAAATQGARISFSTPIWTVSAGWKDIMD